ncbi:hemerythrin domain-containing protein [Modestobacter sp. NPDC049651]|uniref:hemerythrin domain-containing protein n=1 Tax=unclassified Modestobacter TaxID=2643866 RepID=UPI0033D06424
MDITEIILEQHHQQRRMFAYLDEMPRGDNEALGAMWDRLAAFLEVHAEGEERYFYPRVLQLGKGNPDGDVHDEVEDAVSDHNEIRDAVRAAGEHQVGTDEWWTAVWEARKANDDHMGEEEREDLLDFRHHADLQTRHDIAVQFLAYEARHWAGIPIRDKDPETYIQENS